MEKKTLVETLSTFCTMSDKIKSGFFSSKVQYLEEAKGLSSDIQKQLSIYNSDASEDIDPHHRREISSIITNISDLLLGICNDVETKNKYQILFSTKAVLEVSYSFTQIRSLFEITADFIKFSDESVFNLFRENQAGFEVLYQNFISNHQDRLHKGVCLSGGSSIYLNILTGMRNVSMQLMKLVFLEPVISS